MKNISVEEALAHFSALLTEVEAGEEVAVTRHGRVVARLAPERPRMAAEVFRPFWETGAAGEIDFSTPDDPPAEEAPWCSAA